MKRKISLLGMVVAAVSLSGCYYDPGYSYVRNNGSQGDVYYGRSAPVYDDGYYGTPGYYNYYGCCYDYGYAPGVSIGVTHTWYGGARYRHGDRGGWHRGHAYGGDRRPAYRDNDHRGRGDHGRNRGGSDRRGQDGHGRHHDRDDRR
ncbi:hypothetical protein ASD22_01090 [Rhodanobacter sp. Root480]|uniref:Lipoprotein n=1 Tax=Rhodanobacter ginsenosidimutans TaxID=490571 RepID=A0ABW0JYI5_9GAMM|nr:hypothetical protein [Rhodanobacter sp. Root480]KQX98934.1 hypothetical protein ASD22_01090 [Rhodanobacter sp. Root480]